MQIALRRWLAAGALVAAASAIASGGCSGTKSATVGSIGTGGSSVPIGGSGGGSTAGEGGSTGSGASTQGGAGAGGARPAPNLAGAKWEQIPGSGFSEPHCYIYQSVPGTLTFPHLVWSSCGTGCESADPLQGYSGLPPAGFASSSTANGTAYVQFFLVFKGTPWNIGLYRVVRLSDGATVMAYLQESEPVNGTASCDFGYPTATALMQYFWGGADEASIYGFAPQAPAAKWIWPMPPRTSWPPGPGVRTDTAFILTGKGGVYGMLHPETSSDFTTLESPSDSMYAGAEGDLAVWPEWTTPRIRGWAPDGKGVRTLVQSAPLTTCHVQPSPTHLVGIAMDDDCAHGYQGGVRVWHSPRVYAETTNVTLGPVLESDVLVDPVGPRTWGDYAAFVGYDQPQGVAVSDAGHLDVVQLSTGKAWRIDPEAGFSVQQASFTFDSTWLYYGETVANASGTVHLYQLRRLRLDHLDLWGKAL